MSKTLDPIKQAEPDRLRGEAAAKPAAPGIRDTEDAIEALAELRNRIEAERDAEAAHQARGAEERRA